MYRLVFLSGSNKGRRITVQRGDVIIGSDRECAIRITQPGVAGRHAILEHGVGGAHACVLRRLSAVLPVKVNGEPMQDARELRTGDEFEVGPVGFLFQRTDAAAATSKRRFSKFHGLTFLSVGLILAAQAVIVAGLLTFWRMDRIPDHPVTPIDEMGVTPAATMEPGITNRFRAVPDWVVTPAMEQGTAPRLIDLNE